MDREFSELGAVANSLYYLKFALLEIIAFYNILLSESIEPAHYRDYKHTKQINIYYLARLPA